MNFRIYIQKKIPFDIDSIKFYQELKSMDISLSKVVVYYIYDIFHISKELFLESLSKIFVDPVTDILHQKIDFDNSYYIEKFTEKCDDRADAAMQCIKILDPKSNSIVKTGQLIQLIGINKNQDFHKIKKYYINSNENLNQTNGNKNDIKIVDHFIDFSIEKIKKFHNDCNLSIDINDLLFIQKYFIKEKRNPTEAEFRILDAYWSDHCRHKTFYTNLVNISFDGVFKNTYQSIFRKYLKDRETMGRSKDPIHFMDLSNLPATIFYKKGKLKNYVQSREHNACIIRIHVDIIGKKKEKWYLLFKNETHNHPTEIDPFGGASTCIGGAIRDPLSGRAFVYQGLRLSGAADPTNSKTINGKLPQHKICFESAHGYSSYGNQVGLATTHVNEIYHEGYRAKRMEVGMVIGAVPVHFLKQREPKKGDVILLIGGFTGKEGIGGATDSSKEYNANFKKNIQLGQKGNPIIERKIQRFFRKKEVISLIKKCNDFGAGGAAVAIGELSDSLALYLDKIPMKNEKMEAIEIALSESQERMAVVLDPKNVKKFIHLAWEENIMSTPIAEVTDNKRIIFYYKGKEIFNVKSSFMNTRGAPNNQSVSVSSPTSISPFKKSKKILFSKKTFLDTLSRLNIASQKNLVEMFDSTVGGTTVLMPFGGKHQITPSEGSVQKIPILKGTTNTVSLASWGFHPEISSWSPLHGGAYAILECISKIVSMGGDYKNTYFSFQEYYQKLGNNPKNWGKPFSALLGAYHAQMSLGLVSIGGKDSMSGTYNNIHVPPTFIAFGVATGSCLNVISPELKKIGNKIYLYSHHSLKNEMPDFDSIKKVYDQVYEGICSGKIVSVKTVKDGGISVAIAKMAFGNRLGVVINCKEHLLEMSIGSLIIEASSTLSDNFVPIGEVTSNNLLVFNGLHIEINEAINHWFKTLSPVFSYSEIEKSVPTGIYLTKQEKKCDPIVWKCLFKKKGKPRVFIPIFPGTNNEFESVRMFEKEGSIVNTFVFKNLNSQDIIESIFHIKKRIESVQIFMLCGGFSAGDEPDGAAKFIVSILHNPYIKDAIQHFLDKDGLILGICNGFQGLIKSGLLPYGKICLRNNKSPTLTYNKIRKHISQCVHIKVISDQSPWLNGMKNKIYTLPISHSEGRFYASKEITNILFQKNQIATQYVDLEGNPSLDRLYNPNGSIDAVEGLLSENGKIYGRMTHPERYDHGLLKNIPNVHEHSIFKNAVQYFL
ncbi:phosphoribosylformylglycinamidine synthase [Blattabacterium sp. (Blattella germanica) str. Bge]|uniref:phosphoribosylformylglycinamidine synthase n=1 Tax=Blattabacterium sp. (Blattella germanica) TaxID=624186 RepID=UPI0001BB6223|nr:phosphoribosylformylglycinamidine synthase [Blattabacterium sp. (Blattella germanica)]ACY40493.1 phosphoribosylformylglycinamidine synthase [Blattabacterium sp. (Blattella germanica) str. Bge]